MNDQLSFYEPSATGNTVRAVARPQHMHANSLAAYREDRVKLSARSLAILIAVKDNSAPMYPRQILKSLYPQSDNVNLVNPRITELVTAGLLFEVGTTIDPATNKPVRLLDVRAKG